MKLSNQSMNDEAKLIGKIDKALGKKTPLVKSASVQLLEKIVNQIEAIAKNDELTKYDRKNLVKLYQQIADKVELLTSPKIVMPAEIKIKDPVSTVTIKNPVTQVSIDPKGWGKDMINGQKAQEKLLGSLTKDLVKFVKAVTDISTYEGKNKSLRTVMVGKNGEEEYLSDLIANLAKLVNAMPRGQVWGSGGASLTDSKLTDILTAINARSLPIDLTYTSYDPGITDGNLTLAGLAASKHAEVYFILCNNWNTDLLEFDILEGSGGAVKFGFGLAKDGGIVAMHLPGAWVLASNTNPYFDRISGGAAGKTGITLAYRIVND